MMNEEVKYDCFFSFWNGEDACCFSDEAGTEPHCENCPHFISEEDARDVIRQMA